MICLHTVKWPNSYISSNSLLHTYTVQQPNCVIWPIDRTLSGSTTPGQSGPGTDGDEGALCILQSSNITEASPSDCLVSYSGHSLVVVGSLTLLQRCSQCILKPQPTKPWNLLNIFADLNNAVVSMISIFLPIFNSSHLFSKPLGSSCCILTSNPAKHAIPKTAEVHIPVAWASLADGVGQG